MIAVADIAMFTKIYVILAAGYYRPHLALLWNYETIRGSLLRPENGVFLVSFLIIFLTCSFR